MTDTARRPTFLLRACSVVARCLLWLALLAWLAFTLVWGSLHGWIVPRIEEFRPRIEIEASRFLGVPVRIGAISARTVGLVPSFDLKQVTLLDPEGRVALALPIVSVSLSPRSVLNGGFEQLYIDRPELDVRRTAQGRFLVAGLDFSSIGEQEHKAKDWFFSQAEVVILGGRVRWTDEQRGMPALELGEVNFVARNTALSHTLRLDATPPAEWGGRFSLAASFRESLLAIQSRVWDDWEGTVYADFPRVDVSRLRRYADLGVEVNEGHGALRIWSDWSKGQLGAVTADLALDRVQATLGARLPPLILRSVAGRLAGTILPDGFEFSTQDLGFHTDDGIQWPGGNISVKYLEPPGREAKGEFRADRFDLFALSRIAGRLPIGQEAQAALAQHDPKGLVETFQAFWQGPWTSPSRYDIRGRVKGIELAARSSTVQALGPEQRIDIPGIRGLTIDFEANQNGGSAKLAVQNGAILLPGVFDDAVLLLDQLSAEAQWKLDGQRVSIQVPQMKFSNADGEGEAQASWRTGDTPHGGVDARFPGVLDLRASMSRAEGNRVYRYLPKVIPKEAREYVRDAVVAGRASNVKFRVKGDLLHFPFADPRQGEFRISANVEDASFAYMPDRYAADPADRWPALTQLSGELIFDRQSLQVKVAAGRVSGKPGLQLGRTHALINDLTHEPVVAVSGEVKGPLTDMLAFVAETPAAGLTRQALNKATATGSAEVKLQLSLPILALEKSKVQGSVMLPGNDVQMLPDTPALSRVRGTVNFSEQGVTLTGVSARMYGGEVRLEGESRTLPAASAAGGPGRSETVLVLRAQGVAQVEALRRASELGFAAQLARYASGSAAYSGVLTLGRGVPEISLTSNLRGVAINLPPPFRKEADATLALRYENVVTKFVAASSAQGQKSPAQLEDRLLVDVGALASIQYLRDLSGDSAKVLRGSVQIGAATGEAAKLPEHGVFASVRVDQIDVGAWQSLLNPNPSPGLRSGLDPGAAAGRRPATGETLVLSEASDYLPKTWSLHARELIYEGRRLNDVAARGSVDGSFWRANVDARELSGQFEFRQGQGTNAGRLHARLARLSLAATDAAQVEALLESQPQSIPALDIVVEDFELRGKKLGRVEIDAVNRGGDSAGAAELAAFQGTPREWRLNKLNLQMPEATLTASGNWAALGAQAPVAVMGADSAAGRPARTAASARGQRTVMNFKLDVLDSGDLLGRLGMKDVVRKGKGRIEGQIAWLGSPLQMDYASMRGQFTVGFESGQFLKADPGIAKLLSVLSLQTLPRRLALDFRDVFSEGFAFDFVRGDVKIEQGVATTNNLQMKGVSAAVLMEGRADIARETQDISVVVVPEINAGTLSLVATAINPAIGIGSFLAQLFLRRPLIQAGTREFRIDGSWADPRVTRLERGRNAAQPAEASATESK